MCIKHKGQGQHSTQMLEHAQSLYTFPLLPFTAVLILKFVILDLWTILGPDAMRTDVAAA